MSRRLLVEAAGIVEVKRIDEVVTESELEEIFPPEFPVDPLGIIADQLEEKGIPFAERPATGNDAEIPWNPDEALIGTDPPLTGTDQDGGL